ncbi:MAG: efflux transporter outer membrane subunit [Deltaproteobacteria bacterium]|nr:efflux transporter outer membrane subunit [Deltaproteobacteria bacterium]
MFAAFFSAACSLAPEYTRPELPVPPGIVAGDKAARLEPDLYKASVGEFFQDKRLQALITLGLARNRDLKIAALAVLEAKSRYRIQRAESLPEIGAAASGDYRGGFGKTTDNSYEVAGMAAFELDLFGRLKSLNEAALQNYLATEEAAAAARISLVAGIAESYLASCLAEELLQLSKRTRQSRRDSYAFIEARVASGQAGWLDLEQARSMLEFSGASQAEAERELIRANNALALLLGHYDSRDLPKATPLAEQRLLQLPEGVASGALLARPDVLQAEHALMAANADIGAARAAFFPTISLTGSLGYMSGDLNQLVRDASSFWSFLPGITLPIFSGGRNKAELNMAEIRKESSIAQYEKTIQNAFREVADALLSRATFAEQEKAQERLLRVQRRVLELARDSYINGAVSYLEVLEAEREVFEAERTLLGIRRARLSNDIALYAALGGGLE